VGYVDKECKRLTKRGWPAIIELGKVAGITAKTIGDLVRSIGYEVDILRITAGSPSQDLTSLLANRKGLAGSRSKLFFEIPRIHKICVDMFPVRVALMVENVHSMMEDNRDDFSRVLGRTPLLVMAGDLSWVRRPRLYWISWDIVPQGLEKLVDFGVSRMLKVDEGPASVSSVSV
jgi:hypothetical protein